MIIAMFPCFIVNPVLAQNDSEATLRAVTGANEKRAQGGSPAPAQTAAVPSTAAIAADVRDGGFQLPMWRWKNFSISV